MDRYMAYLAAFEDQVDEVVSELVQWIRSEFEKTKAAGVILGMSGGLDCCTVARLVQLADIPLQLVGMPNQTSMDSDQTREDIQALITKFSMNYLELPVSAGVQAVTSIVEEAKGQVSFAGNQQMALANIPPILRMCTLSTLGQAMNYVLIGTGNLTERTMGYFTKRGDGLSDFNPLGYLTKSEIRVIARFLTLPAHIISKAPSANLWAGQSDEEEMGVKIADIDRYLLTKEGEAQIVKKIKSANARAQHKLHPIPMFPFQNRSGIHQSNEKRVS